MLRYIWLFALIIAVVTAAEAASPEIRPGEYVLDADRGTLNIRKGERNQLSFEIASVGGNCHTCSVSGVISGAVGRAKDGDEDDSVCEISFSSEEGAIVVRPITEGGCSYYCGARAGFEGTYRIPPAACTGGGRQKQRDTFLRLYKAHQFAQAGTTLQNLISQCEVFMGWVEIDQVRNDLALAQYRNGEFQQCLTTLNKTMAGTIKGEEELNAHLPPCDFDNYVGVAKGIWFNRDLCTKKMTKQR